MSAYTNDKRTYMALGLLDFLAYYVPGVLAIVFTVMINGLLKLGFSNPVDYVIKLSDDRYVLGVTWTVLSLVAPYVIGNLIFPIGYLLAGWFFQAIPPKVEGILDKRCCSLKSRQFCQPESIEFARCIFRCFRNSPSPFNDHPLSNTQSVLPFHVVS